MLLDWTGAEPFALPADRLVAAWLLLNAGLALVFNAALVLALTFVSPLTVAVGCMATIPLAAGVGFHPRDLAERRTALHFRVGSKGRKVDATL